MEAKDTVVKLKAVPKEIFENRADTIHTKMCYVAGFKEGTEIQAEISFKAGIKEVVEAIKTNDPWLYAHLINGVEMQAKLKEWGME